MEYRGIRYTVRARIERDGHVSLTCPGKKAGTSMSNRLHCTSNNSLLVFGQAVDIPRATELKLNTNENAKPRLPVDSDPDPRYNLITIEQR